MSDLEEAKRLDEQQTVERLIWSLNPASLAEQPLVNPETWGGSVQHELVQFGMHMALSQPRSALKPYLPVAVVMMVKDEADIIGDNLRWLHFLGVRRVIILDNNSTDDTSNIIARFRHEFQDVELLTLHDPIVRYIQAEKTTGLYRLATSIWPDLRWVFPIDADEFLIAQRGLEVLEAVPDATHALTLPKVIHFRHTLEEERYEDFIMEKMAYRSPLFCVPPKVAIRNNKNISITQGNHKIDLDSNIAIYNGGFRYGLYYREFPTRSFEHFLRKVRNGGPAIRAAERHFGRSVGGEHWVRYYQDLLTGGEANLLNIYNRDWVRGQSPGFVLDLFLPELHRAKNLASNPSA